MLLRFILTNYRSFRNPTEFNLFPGSFKIHSHRVFHGDVDLLRVGALYGANASGKSNFIRALHHLSLTICTDELETFHTKSNCFKGDKDALNQPVEFEIEFKAGENYYSYGLHLLHDFIASEWLVKLNPKKPEDDETLLERESDKVGNTKLTPGKRYSSNVEMSTLFKLYAEDIIKPNEPFLKIFKERAEKNEFLADFSDAYDWFDKQLVLIRPHWKASSLPILLYKDLGFKSFALNLLKNLDLGISDLKFKTYSLDTFFSVDDEETKDDIISGLQKESDTVFIFQGDQSIALMEEGKPVVKTLMLEHMGQEKTLFDFEDESDGTQRIFDFIPVIYKLLEEELVLVVDEIEQSIHPSLIKGLLSKLLNDHNMKGQVVFTTHESHLLDLKLFRQDEIWFVEKDEKGSSKLYPLSDFKPRHDLDLRKGYLSGRFNAIPFLGNLQDLGWTQPLEKNDNLKHEQKAG